MIKYTNSYIIVDLIKISEYPHLLPNLEYVLETLTYVDDKGKSHPMYSKTKTKLKIPMEYSWYVDMSFLYPYLSEDSRTYNIPHLKDWYSTNYEEIENVLYTDDREIKLRDDQVFAISQMLASKVGIVQMSTGSGKTFTMAGYLGILIDYLGYVPNVLILEPTTRLVDQTVEEFNSVGIPAEKYREDRQLEGIKVTHPASLNNDIKNNPDHVKDLHILISDEGHHMSADSWNYLLDYAPNLEVRIAVSASIISPDILDNNIYDMTQYSWEEFLLVGILGRVIVNLPPKFYIERGILATPVILRIDNPADEDHVTIEKNLIKAKLSKRKRYPYGRSIETDWHLIRKHVLNSSTRYVKAMEILYFLSSEGYRCLALVSTKDQAKTLMSHLYGVGLGDITTGMFGGNSVVRLSVDSSGFFFEDRDIDNPDNPDYDQIIVGTSVMYEGVDLPMLDAVVFFDIGKEPRVLIQTTGRVLRKSKTGKYAYVIDFTDTKSSVLNRHSEARLNMLTNIVGVSPLLTYDKLTTSQAYQVFKDLENLK